MRTQFAHLTNVGLLAEGSSLFARFVASIPPSTWGLGFSAQPSNSDVSFAFSTLNLTLKFLNHRHENMRLVQSVVDRSLFTATWTELVEIHSHQ